MAIQIKTLDQLKTMRRAGLLVGQTLELLRQSIKVGMRTDALDAIAAANIKRGGGTSNFLGYHGYPATICISINDEIVHGIPGDRVIQDGDVVSIDCGAIIDGWHGDAAFSYGVGTVDPADQKMMDVCEESMWRGFAAAKVGGRLTDISHAVGSYIDSFWLNTVDMALVPRCIKSHMYLTLVSQAMAQNLFPDWLLQLSR